MDNYNSRKIEFGILKNLEKGRYFMKKVAIVTLTGNNNYGNRLQNYALTKVLNSLNCEVKTIWLKKSFLAKVKNFIKKILGLFIKKYKIDKKDLNRTKNIANFTNKYLENFYISKKNFSKINKKFDKVVVGSDQVWNPDVCKKNNMYLLPNIDYSKKIAYAASMGVSNFDDTFIKLIKDNLTKEKFKWISVREDLARKVIRENVNRNDIELLIDPTMLLTKNEWESIEEKPKNYNGEKIILTYFLGNQNSERRDEIIKFANENDCKVINLMDKNDPFYKISPSEFLYLEHHAFLICTDSFHSCVFATLFERPFVVFERNQKNMNNMGSRIDNLLSTFKINNRKFKGKITNEQLNCDYSNFNVIIKNERAKSLKFLKKSLEEIKK